MLTVILNAGGWIELVMWITSSFGLSETVIAQTSMAVVVTARILAADNMYMQIVTLLTWLNLKNGRNIV